MTVNSLVQLWIYDSAKHAGPLPPTMAGLQGEPYDQLFKYDIQ